MTTLVAVLNIVLGTVYLQYGTMTILDMKRSWKTLGFTHFGMAWILMAFTCGPHHLAHGIHLLSLGRLGGPLDAVAVLFGLPVGVIWFLLRVEAFRGGRGDRFIPGTPFGLMAMPTLAAVYATALFAASLDAGTPSASTSDLWAILPNVLLVPIYCTIGYFLLRTQLRNHALLGGWSVSGLGLSAIFPTCALMHAVFALYTITGRYGPITGGNVIDWLSVPAGLYFLLVVRGLYMDTIEDWNRATPDAQRPVVVR